MTKFAEIETRNISLESIPSVFEKNNIIGRIWRKDHTVWAMKDEEISNRLGWLEAPARAAASWGEWKSFAAEARADGFTNALLLGMGGSSLAPEVFARIFGPSAGGLKLDVLDTTDPAAVLWTSQALPIERTIVLVSSKSGTTLETASLMNYFYARAAEALGSQAAGRRFVAITDPGSKLEVEARRLGFRAVFPGEPEIGGRFSVFSAFGLVPAALIGVEGDKLLASAEDMAALCRHTDLAENPGARLGAAMGACALAGRDKARFLLSPRIEPFGAWIEQLIAESTGKNGRGILPLVRGAGAAAEAARPESRTASARAESEDELIVAIRFRDEPEVEPARAPISAGVPTISILLDDLSDLGGQFFLWEFATAVAGTVLGINPFDQPNVALSKKKTEAALRRVRETGSLPDEVPSARENEITLFGAAEAPTMREGLRAFLAQTGPRDYVAVQAFLPPAPGIDSALRRLAGRIEARTGRPTTYDFGPRFLHSTGQLHKGDAGGGLFLQLTSGHPEDAAVPDAPEGGTATTTFGRMIDAQALGDREALREKGRRIARLHFEGDPQMGIHKLSALLGSTD